LYRCLVRRLVREPALNKDITGVSRAIASENLWRAQRDGVRASFIEIGGAHSRPCSEYLGSLLKTLAPDIDELDCEPEIIRAKEIVARGTSADHQLAILAHARDRKTRDEPLEAVVDWIAKVTAKVC
jgi:glutamate---cysteine ligase / carboxylate-amine ligase